MKESRLGWVLLVLWSAWIYGLTGWVAAGSGLGPWLPDLGLVLLVALGPRLRPSRLALAALCVALARIAHSVDPPVAILSAYLGVVLFHGFVRDFVSLEEPLSRALFGAVVALGLSTWWALVHAVREPELEVGIGVLTGVGGALATGLAALVAPVLLRLPGLRLLRRRV